MSGSRVTSIVEKETSTRRARFVYGFIKTNRDVNLSMLAQAIGQHASTVSRKLSGQLRMSHKDWEDIAKFLGMTLDELDQKSQGSATVRALEPQTMAERHAILEKFMLERELRVYFPLTGTPDRKLQQILEMASRLGPSVRDGETVDFFEELRSLAEWTALDLIRAWIGGVPMLEADHKRETERWLLVIGPRGSGKTTLAKLAETMLQAASVRPVYVSARDIADRVMEPRASAFRQYLVDDLHVCNSEPGREAMLSAAQDVVDLLRRRLGGIVDDGTPRDDDRNRRIPKAVFFLDPTFFGERAEFERVFGDGYEQSVSCLYLEPVRGTCIRHSDFLGTKLDYQQSVSPVYRAFLDEGEPRPWLASFALGRTEGDNASSYSRFVHLQNQYANLHLRVDASELLQGMAEAEKGKQMLLKAKRGLLLDALQTLAEKPSEPGTWLEQALRLPDDGSASTTFAYGGNPLVAVDQEAAFGGGATLGTGDAGFEEIFGTPTQDAGAAGPLLAHDGAWLKDLIEQLRAASKERP